METNVAKTGMHVFQLKNLVFYLLVYLIILSGNASKGQTSFPAGCYMSFEEIQNKTPSINCNLYLVVPQSDDTSLFVSYGYNFISPDDTLNKRFIEKTIWAVSDGKDMYLNGYWHDLHNCYCKVMEHNDGLFFHSVADKDNSSGGEAVITGGIIAGGIVAGEAGAILVATAIDVAGALKIKYFQTFKLDLKTGEVFISSQKLNENGEFSISNVCNEESIYYSSLLINKAALVNDPDDLEMAINHELKEWLAPAFKVRELKIKQAINCNAQGCNYAVLNSSGYPDLDIHAIEFLDKTTEWIPAKLNGKQVDSWVSWTVKVKNGKIILAFNDL